MTIENFLPVEHWGSNVKDLLKSPSFVAGVTAALGPTALVAGPLVLLGPLVFNSVIIAVLVEYFFHSQKIKKIKAILDTFENQYSEDYLEILYVTDRQEFHRLFRLASDATFRKYIREQGDHKKAQEIIIKMQQRINEMQIRLDSLTQKESKHKEDIALLKEEINVYEEIFNNWKKAA
jgi:hypothetical protein